MIGSGESVAQDSTIARGQHLKARPKRIALLTDGLESYGVKRSITTLLKAFRTYDIEIVYIGFFNGPMAEAAAEVGAEIFICDFGQAPEFGGFVSTLKNFAFSFSHARTLAETIKTARVDCVIVRQPREVPLVAKACWHAKVSGYWLMPNLISSKYPFRVNAWIYELVLAGFGMTPIANSAFTQTTLIGKLKKAYHSHLGIDPAEFSPELYPSADRAQFGFTPDHRIFGIFARITPEKGQLEFIQGFATAARGFPDARLLICGGPMDSDYGRLIKNAATDLKIADKIYFSGPSDKLGFPIQSLYAMCDVIVNSRIDPEPFGLSVIEGMLMEKPLLVHASGGPAETVKDNEDGWHVRAGTAAAFGEGVARALRQQNLWSKYGRNARRHALRDFTHVAAARRILSIMQASAAPQSQR
ncbi:glycosyltransferase family 4 protein [Bradyrhizobium yuanmingense]|uniref:glycosyltransferase family 4 protein n=1 Tax=Bradyrhizobium yuanmingense TaxID=108015 RepID=UPI0023B9B262|nr:glycosyltransferase family 4 protein [Bradyrhizobium yuanmingense]MDF0516823.1 glycosyltransferase family 4 protein [Bradyrhizobium yuanmingense]